MYAKVSLMFFETLFVVASPGSSGILCGLVFLNEATKIERITGGDVLAVLRRAAPKKDNRYSHGLAFMGLSS